MLASCMLSRKEYTTANALTWGNCRKHFEKAFDAKDLILRVAHIAIAILEAIPVIGQIVSFIEMAVVSCYLKSKEQYSSIAEVIKKLSSKISGKKDNASPLKKKENLTHLNRSLTPLQVSKDLKLQLPKEKGSLPDAVSPLLYKLAEQYKDLPWPESVKKVVFFTNVTGGRGDIMASAKAIERMQEMYPDLEFDWVLKGSLERNLHPANFLSSGDTSKITIRNAYKEPTDKESADLLVSGPVKGWNKDYTQNSLVGRQVDGAWFGFLENASESKLFPSFMASALGRKLSKEESEGYSKELHNVLFPSGFSDQSGYVAMGLDEGSGVFLDQERINTQLSQGYFEPKRLKQIQDESLRKDVLESMGVFEDDSEPDYSQISFNSGYAHRPASWGNFIDCVSIHEKQKHVSIVLNQHGEFDKLSTEDFEEIVFTPERLERLKAQGYGTIILKGENETRLQLDAEDMENSRRLVVIVRPSFKPQDMKQLQLASERLLATGDSTAVEAWCSRCKLYLYEDVSNGGCKWKFLQQQVDLAEKVSPKLSRLLSLFGRDVRLSVEERNLEDNLEEVEKLLNDPDLSDSTLEFCDRIVSNNSFNEVFESALKRSMWHHILPSLAELEIEQFGDEFKEGFVEYLKDPKNAEKRNFTITDFDEFKELVEDAVAKYQEG